MNKINMFIKNRKSKIASCIVICCLAFSCNYLDVVPDNIPTIEHAFRNRTEAQRYLYGLLGGMPDVGNCAEDPALTGSDEIYVLENHTLMTLPLRRIMNGEQSAVDPIPNYWASRNGGFNLRGGKSTWTNIADCNYFLENIHLPFDIEDYERAKWRGEALFVKAYLHFWLFRQYGPIPLIRENLSIDTESEQIMRYREPVDDVTDYIVSLLDEAIDLLPLRLDSEMEEMGRPNKCIAAALKAQVLTLAASPLYNCNLDYKDYKDNRGVQLFPQDQSAKNAKWKKAADAAKEAIDLAHEGLYRLYDAHTDMQNATSLSEETLLALQVRCAVTERWNDEIIWGNSRINNNSNLQRLCMPHFATGQDNGSGGQRHWAPTLRMVEQFYTKNGLPIEDDKEWTGKYLWAMRTATGADKQYIRQDKETIELHFDREARFYGSICFDQGTFFGNNQSIQDNSVSQGNLFVTEFKKGMLNGYFTTTRSSYTGYLCKKLLNYRSTCPVSTSVSYTNFSYAYPIIRLADLYLLYAEALNEWKDRPDGDVYEYIDLVRERSGLKGVVESWRDHAVASKENYPADKEKMRDIIQRERMNELAFEGSRYWDLRRWKLAEEYLNRPIRGLNIWGETAADFYAETELFTPRFEKKDYFTPIRTELLIINTNLLQSPYW